MAAPLTAGTVEAWWVPGGAERPALRRQRVDHVLRAVLAAHLAVEPAALQFGREPRGRPFLRAAAELARPPQFNLSDTRGGSVVAVSATLRVGVDLEREDRSLSHRALARRYFAPAEAAALEALEEDPARRAFLALWTAKESACKATGTGIYGWLDGWQFAVADGDPVAQAVPVHAGAAADWSFRRLAPAAGYTAVVSAAGTILGVQLHDGSALAP